jgi:hypothetical protein
MPRAARYEAIDPTEVQIVHAVNRCKRKGEGGFIL